MTTETTCEKCGNIYDAKYDCDVCFPFDPYRDDNVKDDDREYSKKDDSYFSQTGRYQKKNKLHTKGRA